MGAMTDGAEAIRGPDQAPARPPAAYGDHTVSRIRAKYETRYTARFGEDAERRLVAEIMRATSARFGRGRSLERAGAARMEAAFRAVYAEAPFLLSSRDEERAPTRVKPRSWALAHNRLHASAGDDGLVRLQSACLTANRRGVEYVVVRSHFCWGFHAQTRLHERTPERVRADREIACAVTGFAGILQAACDGLAGLGEPGVPLPERFAIPCHEGLLLGRFEPVNPELVTSRRTFSNRDRYGSSERVYADAEGESGFTYVGRTYVGPDEMRPEQFALRDRLARVADSFAEMSRTITEGFAGRPLGELLPDARGVRTRGESQEDAMARLMPARSELRDLHAILTEPAMLAAMGNARCGR